MPGIEECIDLDSRIYTCHESSPVAAYRTSSIYVQVPKLDVAASSPVSRSINHLKAITDFFDIIDHKDSVREHYAVNDDESTIVNWALVFGDAGFSLETTR